MRIEKMDGPMVMRRKTLAKNREIRRLLQAENAHEAVRDLTPGCEIFGFSKGQFSLINLIEEVLVQTGPADVTVSTWTAANAEIERAYSLMKNRDILSMRFLVDFSFQSRQPGYCTALRSRFGDKVIRVTKTHAKFVLVRNKGWNLVIRTSMNLNENPRFENFEISDDLAMAEFLESVIKMVFDTTSAKESFGLNPYGHVEKFEELGVDLDAAVEGGADLGRTLDDGAKPGFRRL